MSHKFNCIMLVDDDGDDNFFHERIIRKSGIANSVVALKSGQEALEYLRGAREHQGPLPDLLLLDLNMPGMDGWEFLAEYDKLDKDSSAKMVIVILSTSQNPDDERRARTLPAVSGFKTKPLTKGILDEIAERHLACRVDEKR